MALSGCSPADGGFIYSALSAHASFRKEGVHKYFQLVSFSYYYYSIIGPPTNGKWPLKICPEGPFDTLMFFPRKNPAYLGTLFVHCYIWNCIKLIKNFE